MSPSDRHTTQSPAKPLWPLIRLDEVTDADAPAVYGILQPGPDVRRGVRYVRPTEIQDDKIVIENLRRTSAKIAKRYKRSALKSGDVILSIVGTIGKVALVPRELDGGNITQSAVRIRPRHDVLLPEFLAWVLRSPLATRQYAASMLGSAVMRLNVAHVRALLVPVPPLDVQRRIIADIERRLTRLEAAENILHRVGTTLRRYRASVFKAACEGRLVCTESKLAERDTRGFITAAELLKSTPRPPLPNRWRTRSTDTILGHAALAVGNPGSSLPKGWIWVALTDIARMESGHTPSRSHPSWWKGDIPWLGLADARSYDGNVINDTTQHTNADGLANSAARLLPAGTVCVSRTAAIGYVVVLGRPMATSQDFVNWIPTEAVTSDWLRIVFSADREVLRRFGKGSIHTTIYFPELLALHIALPPMAEQLRISVEVERRLTISNRSQFTMAANLARAARLRRCILAEVFASGVAESDKLFEHVPDTDSRANIRDRNHTSQGLVMPAKKSDTFRKTRPLLELLRDNPKGMTVEELFTASGYFEAGDPDSFYQELAVHRSMLEEIRPRQAQTWPSKSAIRLKLKRG